MSEQDNTVADATSVTEDMEKRTRQFIEVRDKIAEVKDRQAAELKPLLEIQEVLAGRIQAFMQANKLENLKTSAGTCYVSTRYSASLADPEAFMQYVIANSAFDLMDRRANVTAVKDFVSAHKQLPPGCNLSAIETLGVRRPGSAKKD